MTSNSFFPDEYFTCSCLCLSCGYVSPHYMLSRNKNHRPGHSLRPLQKKGAAPFNYIITFKETTLKTPGVCLPILDLTPNLVFSNFSSGCKRSMNHLKEGLDHEAKHRCRYSAQYDNRIYTCKASTNPSTCVEGRRLDEILSVFAELLRPAMREGRRW